MDRGSKLNKFLSDILHGQQQLTRSNGKRFIEAICVQTDQAACVHRITKGKAGLSSLQQVMRQDLTPSCLNGDATRLLSYIREADLKDIGGGQILQDVIRSIVDPPIFWDAFAQAFRSQQLQDPAQGCFAWLLFELISLPDDDSKPYRGLAEDSTVMDLLLDSTELATRSLGHKIKLITETRGTGAVVDGDYHPGGRHDNDFLDFHDIAIFPTTDEIQSKELPYLRTSAELENEHSDKRVVSHLDNQYRLLREDMVYEMRDELSIVLGEKHRHHRGLVLEHLKVLGIYDGPDDTKHCRWGIRFQCSQDMWQFKNVEDKQRRKHITDNHRMVPHQSVVCLLVDGNIVAFPSVYRDVDLLAEKPPIVVLQFEGEASTKKALVLLKGASHIKLVFINTPMFAYEPILKALQSIQTMPLTQELFLWNDESSLHPPSIYPTSLVQALHEDPARDLQHLLGAAQSIILDPSQARSLLSGLTQKVSLIQGPPGTGKSFIGALLAKAIHDTTSQTIMICCYTNHALDQFLEDLLNIGIAQNNIVRLGSKSTPRTEPLLLKHRLRNGPRRTRADWGIIDNLRSAMGDALNILSDCYARYETSVRHELLLEHLEFEEPDFFEAFKVLQSDNDGMRRVDAQNRDVKADYLLERWLKGKDAGMFKHEPHVKQASHIWNKRHGDRRTLHGTWREAMLKEHAEAIVAAGRIYNKRQEKVNRMFDENVTLVLRSVRIIACTTTGAANYFEQIRAASPEVLLIEEAGEILESHILTALGPNTEQLILIGDHKQLRPKVNNYQLTVEKGEGYNLNRSLFERLVLKGYPHETLTKQHRMRPEISAFIRELTYPELVDADGTKGRPDIRGIQNNVVFITHDHAEDDSPDVADRRDSDSTSSKQNTHEARMVLKIVRYLAQQGYGTDKLVVLTPYLAQLHKLQEELKGETDPVLSDLDSHDLVRAGLIPAATAEAAKKPLRLSTIDNYQGEESDIVIASLTRSNANHDIGFMYAPERLNVLLSRARDGLIMIGNSHTFLNARNPEGRALWNRLFDLLKRGCHIYDGLPVKCMRHSTRTAVLARPVDFDEECPDGGCKEPCGVMLVCGHPCPFKCHQISDHSKMACDKITYDKCLKGHVRSWKCRDNAPVSCKKCDLEDKLAEEKRKKEYDLQQKRNAEQRDHLRQIAQLEEQIAAERQIVQDARIAEERRLALAQKQKDLEDAKSRNERAAAVAAPTNNMPHETEAPTPHTVDSQPHPQPQSSLPRDDRRFPSEPTEPLVVSTAETEWRRQKDVEGAINEHIDAIMEMTGLEDVKAQILRIKAKVDVTKRQGASLKEERFNIVLLGNPGTGKTTVARRYAKLLASIDVLPGDDFIETTGSRLANDGVPGIKKQIEQILKAGGGTMFVDEAYQLTGEHNFQGSQVLDYMLAEMENNVGKIVFILAGYNKQMEKLFEHNPGLTSRVPYRLQFADYTDPELQFMLQKRIEKKYSGRMKVEDGFGGLYSRIAVRRLGRGRGREGFGNARALQNMLDKITERQAARLVQERKEGLEPNDFEILMEDLIGPDPSLAIVKSAAWKKLQDLIGLQSVKNSVQNLIDLIDANYRRELQEKEPIAVSLNRVFLGSPGTGKTSVAKLYGQILVDLGLLSNGEVVVKNPSDFIGSVLGESEKNTSAILATTVGKVLVIDEAYMLYQGSSSGQQSDPYKTAVIDTIVAEVQSVPGEDRCVLLLGYETQMREMFQNVNPGLSRRFAIEDAFHFNDFNDSELRQILDLKLKQQQLDATDAAKDVAIEVLSRARNRPNFGNGGEVENLLSQAKGRFQTRQAELPVKERSFDFIFEQVDFDPEFDRVAHGGDNLKKLFKDVVGCEDVIRKLEEYQHIAQVSKAQGRDIRALIPTTFVFKGPPGTGKTTTARKMGQVYFNMGFLSSPKVHEVSASELVGQYVGHTGPKTKKVFERALGQVLFIDEAYRLGEGHFAKEAMDEIVATLTLDSYKGKIVVILAGYDQEMNRLMAVNTGLSSRFPDEIVFENMKPARCLELLNKELKKDDVSVAELDNPESGQYAEMSGLIASLSALPSWGNARDMMTLSKQMVRTAFKNTSVDNTGAMQLSAADVISCISGMLRDRRERSSNVPLDPEQRNLQLMQQTLQPDAPTAPTMHTSSAVKAKATPPKAAEATQTPAAEEVNDPRDDGVPDSVWRQLCADKKAAEEAARRVEENLRVMEQELREAEAREKEEKKKKLAKQRAAKRAKDAAERDAVQRQLEEQRLKEIHARAERQRKAAQLAAKKQREEEVRRKEAMVQAKLRDMGVCVAGFQWIKQGDGYRCAGGSHWISNTQLGI